MAAKWVYRPPEKHSFSANRWAKPESPKTITLSYKIYKNLVSLNELSADEAEAAFLDCCGSIEWARQMTASRPFKMLEELYHTAENIWFSLTHTDWFEAFATHPKIGSKKAAPSQKPRAAKWSAGEQSDVNIADKRIKACLQEVNRLYQNKFGFIFIVCASGKSSDEMLAICNARLGNSKATEMLIAAKEQKEITEIRLKKLLEL